jgi:hypothetical protein
MFVEPQFIDQLLSEHAHPHLNGNVSATPLSPEAEKILDDVAKNVKQFVHDISSLSLWSLSCFIAHIVFDFHHKSGYEGAEIRYEDDSDFDISEDDDTSDTTDSEESDKNEEVLHLT